MSMSICERPVAFPKLRSRCAVRSYFVRFKAARSSRRACRRQRKLACGYRVVRLDASLDQAREQALALVRRTVVAIDHPLGQGRGLSVPVMQPLCDVSEV